ncbi:MAG: hypothetical protein HY674_06705 [Chloroflexi bacterium]|nr:hypothetical protein [Chloroflexota bacterium]
MQDGRPMYSLETLRAAFSGSPKQRDIPQKTNPLRVLIEWSLDHFHWSQAASLALVWREFPVVKTLAPAEAETLLRNVRLFLKWHAETYLADDTFNAYLGSAASGLQMSLDELAGQLLRAKFDSKPTVIPLNLPDV